MGKVLKKPGFSALLPRLSGYADFFPCNAKKLSALTPEGKDFYLGLTKTKERHQLIAALLALNDPALKAQIYDFVNMHGLGSVRNLLSTLDPEEPHLGRSSPRILT